MNYKTEFLLLQFILTFTHNLHQNTGRLNCLFHSDFSKTFLFERTVRPTLLVLSTILDLVILVSFNAELKTYRCSWCKTLLRVFFSNYPNAFPYLSVWEAVSHAFKTENNTISCITLIFSFLIHRKYTHKGNIEARSRSDD